MTARELVQDLHVACGVRGRRVTSDVSLDQRHGNLAMIDFIVKHMILYHCLRFDRFYMI